MRKRRLGRPASEPRLSAIDAEIENSNPQNRVPPLPAQPFWLGGSGLITRGEEPHFCIIGVLKHWRIWKSKKGRDSFWASFSHFLCLICCWRGSEKGVKRVVDLRRQIGGSKLGHRHRCRSFGWPPSARRYYLSTSFVDEQRSRAVCMYDGERGSE